MNILYFGYNKYKKNNFNNYMELSDYDILGITPKATFRIVKNAYYELSRIYHPDSIQIKSLTKKEKEMAFHKIQSAYENIKKKMNVVEVDLPKNEIEYECDINNPNNEELNINEDKEEKLKKFNKIFEKVHSRENHDNPYSVFYKEPEEQNRNLQDSQIILKSSSMMKYNNIHEFGINYIEDDSNDKFIDIRNLNSNSSESTNLESIKEIKEVVDSNLDKKLEDLLKLRNEKIELSEQELSFMSRQKQIQKDIENSRNKVEYKRTIKLLSK
jgi:DnaJ-class molecular chaperone